MSPYEAYTKREDFQIKNETMVVGIDIAKKTHFAVTDNRGIELGKLLRFENTARGFEDFDAWVQGIMQKNEMTRP